MRLLLTGDYGAAEFSAAVAEMRAACDVVEQPFASEAARWLAAGAADVDLIVVAQGRPGECTAVEIEALRRAAPLAPLVALVGSWCEGELRRGSHWPGVVRIYWHQWPSHFPREMARLARGDLSDWNQPLTATPEERLLSMYSPHCVPPPNPRHGAPHTNPKRKRGTAKGPSSLTLRVGVAKEAGNTREGVIAVMSDHLELAEWLSADCRRTGMETIVFRDLPFSPVKGAHVVLWDAGLAGPTLLDHFRHLVASFFESPVIVLLDFPRSSDVQRLADAGAAAILAKPVMTADLRWCLRASMIVGSGKIRFGQ